ncbi:MAG: protein kinase [Eubacterium sp.]|nr:protein kinase [Eubacterium sp.]
MAAKICFQCFQSKGGRAVCPHCGYTPGSEPEQAYRLTPGTMLHKRYVIGVSIGIGGFGITYKAFDAMLRMVVAVKEFYPAGLVNRAGGEKKVGIFSGEKKAEFQRQLARFLEEARNMALFSREQDIVNVYDYFEENQTAYIIMEYVDAPLLKDELKKRRFSPEEAGGYMLAILQALEKVHGHGIIHKDISPDNIFLTGEDTVKLFDFGAARLQGSERTEAVVVKAGYTPPEQYTSQDAQSLSMDIYAAGAVFYEMLTGEKPVDSRDRVICDELKGFQECGVRADEYLQRIVLKALALEPRLRFQTAGEFKNALIHRKKVLLPQEELRKSRRIRRILTAVLAVVILLAAGALTLGMTVFSGRGKIDVAKLEQEELSVWLLAEDAETGAALRQALLDSAARVCPQLTVHAQAVASEDYAEMVQDAAAQGGLPDVFCTDGQDDAFWDAGVCEELSRLLRTMELSDYLYLDRLSQEDGVYALPTAMQAGIVYISDVFSENVPEFIEMDVLAQQANALGYADGQDVFARFQDPDDPLFWIAGDLSDLDAVEAVTVEAVPSTDFSAVPVVEEGKLVGCMKHAYAVKKGGDKNRQDAAMTLLSLLLSEGMQSAAYMDNTYGIPLNRAVLHSYQEYKLTTYLNCLKGYDLEEVQLYQGSNLCTALRQEAEKTDSQ